MDNEKIQGVIERINQKGIRIDGTWYNYSKHMKESPTVNVGDEIIVEVDRDWIMKMELISDTSNGKTANVYTDRQKREADRQVVITRLAVLNTATEILKTRSKPITSEELFKISEMLEEWVWEGLKRDHNNNE